MADTDTTNATEATNAPGPSTPEVDAIEADIERTREDLAQTVDRLTAKLDVKARVRNRVTETTDRVTSQAAAQGRYLREQVTDEDGKPAPVALTASGPWSRSSPRSSWWRCGGALRTRTRKRRWR